MGPLCCVDWACPVLGVGLSNVPSQTRDCLGDINAIECCPTSGNVICCEAVSGKGCVTVMLSQGW